MFNDVFQVFTSFNKNYRATGHSEIIKTSIQIKMQVSKARTQSV